MARLTDVGPGLNSISMEFPTSVTGTPVIVTTPVRGGAYSIQFTPTAATWVRLQYHTPNTQDVIFYRAYFRLHVAPTGTIPILAGYHGGDANYKVGIRVTPGRLLQFWNQEDGAQIGSDSSALTLDAWYRIEWKIDTTTLASTVTEARAYADTSGASAFWNPSGTVNLTAAPDQLMVGTNASDATADYFISDIAVNNDTGSLQASWCGEAKGEIYLRPDSAGDGTPAWTPLSGANWDSVEENPPDDVTTYVASNTAGQIDNYNLAATPASVLSGDIINCVLVGSRFRDSASTGADPSYALRITTNGTTEETTDILADVSAVWSTIDTSGTKTYKMVLYDLPGASTTGFTKADLDATQIGLKETVSDTHFVWVTAVWLIADFKAASGTTYEDSISLARTMAATIANDVAWGPSISLARTLAVTQGNTVDFQDAVTLGRVLAVAIDNIATLENAINLARTMAVTTIGGLLFEDSVTLGIALAVAIAELITKEESITLASVRGILASAQMDVYPSVSLARVLALSSSELVTFETSITLASGRSISISNIVTFEEAVIIAASFGLSILDQLAGQVILTPVVKLSITIRSRELIIVVGSRHQLGLMSRSRQLTLPER